MKVKVHHVYKTWFKKVLLKYRSFHNPSLITDSISPLPNSSWTKHLVKLRRGKQELKIKGRLGQNDAKIAIPEPCVNLLKS